MEQELSTTRAEYDDMKKAQEVNGLERDKLEKDLSKALAANKELEIKVGEITCHRDELSSKEKQHFEVVEKLDNELKQSKSLCDAEGNKVVVLGEELKESCRMQDSLKEQLRVLGESHRDEVSLLKEEIETNLQSHASSLKSAQEGFAKEIASLKEDVLSLQKSLNQRRKRIQFWMSKGRKWREVWR